MFTGSRSWNTRIVRPSMIRFFPSVVTDPGYWPCTESNLNWYTMYSGDRTVAQETVSTMQRAPCETRFPTWVVDGDDLDGVLAEQGGAQDQTPDTAEAVDANLDDH